MKMGAFGKLRVGPVRRAWIPAILWIAIIGMESFAGSSENTASILRPLLEFVFGPLSLNTFYLVHNFIRKGGHFFGYSVLSLTLYRAWWVTLMVDVRADRLSWREMLRAWSWRAAVLALLGTLAIASLDEWHQSLIRNRTGKAWDVLLDEMGGCLAQLAILVYSLRSPRPKPCAPAEGEPAATSA